MITNEQIKFLQTHFSRQGFDRTERLCFLSDFFSQEIHSTKDLTFEQANFLIKTLNGEEINPIYKNALFDKNNPQHRTILSLCHKLKWVVSHNEQSFADIERLGGWIISKHSPVKKPLSQMNRKELSKIIGALRGLTNSLKQ